MGKKGAKLTAVSTEIAAELVRQLRDLGDVSSKKMFGGSGIFESGKMFAFVDSEGEVFLKADDSNRQQFEEAGAAKHGRMPYFEVPQAILEDDADLKKWARTSMAVGKK